MKRIPGKQARRRHNLRAAVPALPAAKRPVESREPLAVIEIGTTGIRLAVAQSEGEAGLRMLESLHQSVSIGKDTFAGGTIRISTIEECVNVLRGFQRVLLEYGIAGPDRIAVVATGAVREAANMDAFIDRMFTATGLQVRVMTEADVNRLTYLAVAPMIAARPKMRGDNTLVVEVGGGTTEALYLCRSNVSSANTYRLGSLRLRRLIESYPAPILRLRGIMIAQIEATVEQIVKHHEFSGPTNLLALGGDARFAAARISPGWNGDDAIELNLAKFSGMAGTVLNMSVEDIVKRYHMSYPDAETIGPAMLIYSVLAKAMGLKSLFVGGATLRDGLLLELSARGRWTGDFRAQVVNSAMEIGARYHFDREHALRVDALAVRLFGMLKEEHRLDSRYELILRVAALLHETGGYVSNRSHHKHSLYLILNSDLFGLGARDLTIAALTARYHRRAMPKPTHEYYEDMDWEGRVVVAKLAAILRVADALCCRPAPIRLAAVNFDLEPGKLVVGVEANDLSVEEHAMRMKGDMFEEVYGRKVALLGRRRGYSHGRS